MVHTWAKDYEKHNGNLEPVQIFFSGSGGTGKSHLGKVTYNAISKSMLYQCKDPENPRVLLLVHTEISAVSIGETAIHMLEFYTLQYQSFSNKNKMFLLIVCPVGRPLMCKESKNVSCIIGRLFWKVT